MKDITIADAETRNTESRIPANKMDDLDSVPLKSSSLDETAASDCNGPKMLKSYCNSGEHNPLDPVSSASPFGKESNGMSLSSGGGELSPVTPSPNGETMKILSASNNSDDLEVLSECETPTQNTFNPFAPAPEDLPPAPKKKMPREFKIPTRRKLNFDTCCDAEENVESAMLDEEDYILESIWESIRELVVSKQISEVGEDLADEDSSYDDASDGFETPTSVPMLTGISETCPDAPMRLGSESRRPDQSICRKLEFETCLI